MTTFLIACTMATAGLSTAMVVPAVGATADRPCSWRAAKLHFMGQTPSDFGGSRTVTLLNCHPTKRKATIDVSRSPDPDCKKIPFGKTRKFTYMTLRGLASYNKPKWC